MEEKESWLYRFGFLLFEIAVAGGLLWGLRWLLHTGPMESMSQFFGPCGDWIGIVLCCLLLAGAIFGRVFKDFETEED